MRSMYGISHTHVIFFFVGWDRKYQATLMTCLIFDPIIKVQVCNYLSTFIFMFQCEVSQL